MGPKRKAPKHHLLSHSRPPMLKRPSSLSSKTTRALIRNYHILQKELAQAIDNNDVPRTTLLQAENNASGGLQEYQRASILGQSNERGGDTSKVLMEWMDARVARHKSSPSTMRKLRMLEVGALRVDNACSRSGIFYVERIDLCSQHSSILQQNFMLRPLPEGDMANEERFDVVSLSLVVNYVGDPGERGEMLKRVGCFLKPSDSSKSTRNDLERDLLPGLFLVLPAPCLLNSRYLDRERLQDIMRSLGFTLAREKISDKLVYQYWEFHGKEEKRAFPKQELKRGGRRNNFAIILC